MFVIFAMSTWLPELRYPGGFCLEDSHVRHMEKKFMAFQRVPRTGVGSSAFRTSILSDIELHFLSQQRQ